MGLLDEAIREHLELKRRRGADPAEVAREQREALDPISAPAPAAEVASSAAEDASLEDLPTQEHALEADDAIDAHHPDAMDPEGELPENAASPAGPRGESPVTLREPEETAELDMSTVLDEAPSAQALPTPPGDAHAHGAPQPPDEPAQLEHGPSESAAGS
ncbi:MAG TPA: hypothetical protein VGX51_02530 [Solirubrobacteraceae bacterium]|jgi:hypothetical protein|nr:hypothetical protein [Solirubrobacteraceae bacterium]